MNTWFADCYSWKKSHPTLILGSSKAPIKAPICRSSPYLILFTQYVCCLLAKKLGVCDENFSHILFKSIVQWIWIGQCLGEIGCTNRTWQVHGLAAGATSLVCHTSLGSFDRNVSALCVSFYWAIVLPDSYLSPFILKGSVVCQALPRVDCTMKNIPRHAGIGSFQWEFRAQISSWSRRVAGEGPNLFLVKIIYSAPWNLHQRNRRHEKTSEAWIVDQWASLGFN